MDQAISILKKLTRHDCIKLTDRCNSAIFTAMYIAKKMNPRPYLLIPDQGGWISFKTYPKILNMEIKEIKTDRGLINFDDLMKNVEYGSALIMTSFAGYFAEQHLKKISKICRKANCLLIEDASGAIGYKSLCNGKHSDIIVGSFSKWKPINLGYGGFISVKHNEFFENAKEPLSMTMPHPNICDELLPLLNNRRLDRLLKQATRVKKELKDFEIFHRKKNGLNVVTEYNEEIIRYCQEKGYPYILCPTYIRVNEKAISIELKRL